MNNKFIFIIFFCVIPQNIKSQNNSDLKDLSEQTTAIKWTTSRWSVSEDLFNYIRIILPTDKTILELGSGWASEQFSKFYTLYSIEHDKKWMDKYKTNYIYAPIVNKWYNPKILKEKLPEKYDLILVDGPPGGIGRDGFYTYLHLFNTDVIIIFDDVHRKDEYNLMVNVSKKINRPYKIYQDSVGKRFGVIEAQK